MPMKLPRPLLFEVTTMVAMCPPVAAPPQHVPDPPSSQVMMMMPFCANHGELMTGAMLLDSQLSPAKMRLLAQPEAPCMSLQSLGVIHTKSGALAPLSAETSPDAPG